MLVQEHMSRNPITIRPSTSLHEALRIMREANVRRLPVLNEKGKLVGIVLEKDLLYASPSPATSLSVHELNYLVAKIKIEDLMTREVVTVCEDCPLEEAARIMADNDIGGLPVMRDDTLVGMITESDLFKTFLELLGARTPGLRVTVEMHEGKGVLAQLTHEIAERGGNIVSLGTFWSDNPSDRGIVFKAQDIDRQTVEALIQNLGGDILDIRDA
jgi:acetoin utilization protein AcuB